MEAWRELLHLIIHSAADIYTATSANRIVNTDLFCLYFSEILVEHGPGGELVGTDYLGNKYFEKKDAQVGKELNAKSLRI